MFALIVSILGALSAAVFYGWMFAVDGFNEQIWWVHPVVIVIILVCLAIAAWKLEDEFFVFSNWIKRIEEGRCDANPSIKYRKNYRLKGAGEKINRYEYAMYLLKNAKAGGKKILIELAKEGYAPAMASYGYSLLTGEYGFTVDEKSGLAWLKEGEKQNCPVAYTCLHFVYEEGTGVTKNEKKSKEYLKKALAVDHPIPVALLAKGYEAYHGGDEETAKKYFRAAQRKNPNYGTEDIACLALAKELLPAEAALLRASLKKAVTTNKVLRGIALTYEWERNYKKAAEYFSAAASQGMKEAKKDLAMYYLNGLGVEKNPSRAEELYLSLAGQGDAEAYSKLGGMYAQGWLGEPDLEKGEKYMKAAAETGEAKYLYQLAEFYCYIKYEQKKAKPLYKQAAEAGYAPAQTAYGEILCLENKEKQGLEWLRKGAEQGDAESQYKLGAYYLEKEEFAEAFEWLLASAKQGNAYAQFETALLYGKGDGVKKNDRLSAEWMEKAALGGVWRAQLYLGEYYKEGLGVPKDMKLAVYWLGEAEKTMKAELGEQ